jgi:hypothetical protein
MVAKRVELVQRGETQTMIELDAGYTGAESTGETPKAKNRHRKDTVATKPEPETVMNEPPNTGAEFGDTDVHDETILIGSSFKIIESPRLTCNRALPPS